MNYKRLGDYIQSVNKRNKELEVTTLLGVSIKKVLMPSIANTIGTNMKTYKIIEKNQFAYGAVTSRNGDKISIALLEEHEKAIVSQAYTVFEVIDKNLVLPEYLMMWFRRPEFDRYARFKSHGSARETFDWDELCDTQLPIPTIEEQRKIVAEYNTVTNRIKLNEQLNQKLEETAQALYKHWFVDFDFPNEEGKPYKSSGGEMEFNEELEKDIPIGWMVQPLEAIIETINGYAFKSNDFSEKGKHPIIKIKNITPPYVNIDNCHFFEGKIEDKHKRVLLKTGDILITMTGSGANQMNSAVGQVGKYYKKERALMNQRVCKLEIKKKEFKEFCYQFISNKETHLELLNGSTGSANQANISPNQVKNLKIISPSTNYLIKYQFLADKINAKKAIDEKNKLEELQSLLLAKMTQSVAKI